MTTAYNIAGDIITSAHTNAGPATGAHSANLGNDSSGTANGAQGAYSTVLGGDKCSAEGDYAVACGLLADAKGNKSFAAGDTTLAQGENSVAMGSNTYAYGLNSFACGTSNEARGEGTAVFGYDNIAGENVEHAAGTNWFPSFAEGKYAFVGNTANKARAFASTSFGEESQAWGAKSMTMGEDTRTGCGDKLATPYSAFTVAEILNGRKNDGTTTPASGGESSFAGNHFSRVVGRASTTFGCNNFIPVGADRAIALGFGARPTRCTQVAQASGGFVDPDEIHGEGTNRSNAEGLHNALPRGTGHAQTSTLVFRGYTAGSAANEAADWAGGSGTGRLVYDNATSWAMPIEDDKAYACKATAVVTGTISGSGTLRSAMVTRECIIHKTGGTLTIVAKGSSTNLSDGSHLNTAGLDFIGASNDLTLELTTGSGVTAKVRVACKLEFTEVLIPDAFPSNAETWQDTAWTEV